MILTLDQGTSSSRALVWDSHGRVVARAQREVAVRFPQPGWVEQSPREIWATQLAVAREVVAQCGAHAFRAVAIANQRETAMLWRRGSLAPLGPAVVWQCRRTAGEATRLRASHGADIRARTGLVPDAYFSGPKFAWLLDHMDGGRPLAEDGDLAGGTVDSWLLANLTGGAVHATDVTNASRTMLWHLRERRWDAELCDWQHVPSALLPDVRDSASEFGVTEPSLFGRALPILGVAGDQQAALIGHGIVEPGVVKCTYGTGAFVLSHAGERYVGERAPTPSGLLLTASADGGLALEGGVFTAGSVVQWLRDELGLAGSAADISALAASTPDSGGLAFIPALAGLGSPHWDSEARGAILGLTRGATAAQIARAALESVAFRVREIVEAMASDGPPISELRVDGGMTASDTLMQIQANALQLPLVRPAIQETTSLGAARLAMESADMQRHHLEAEGRRFGPQADLEREFGHWTAARRAVQSLARATAG